MNTESRGLLDAAVMARSVLIARMLPLPAAGIMPQSLPTRAAAPDGAHPVIASDRPASAATAAGRIRCAHVHRSAMPQVIAAGWPALAQTAATVGQTRRHVDSVTSRS